MVIHIRFILRVTGYEIGIIQQLIMKCFPCKVFTFGSVPPKTYLPDSDIDLTAFSDSPNLKDS
uniref:Putative polymerase, nucleotidyl transferase domain-containing protein n=1 Tax=Helianthus annuus TaxID=4232 RepID=A0A251TVY7_HELAN